MDSIEKKQNPEDIIKRARDAVQSRKDRAEQAQREFQSAISPWFIAEGRRKGWDHYIILESSEDMKTPRTKKWVNQDVWNEMTQEEKVAYCKNLPKPS